MSLQPFKIKINKLSNQLNNLGKKLSALAWKPTLAIIAVALVIAIIWLIPILEIKYIQSELKPKERVEVINDTRRTLTQIFGIFGGIFLLYLTWRRIEVTQDGQITERFTRAVEQLGATDKEGNKILEIRLGGIYALERIAKDSKKDHCTIMEILTAYARENSPLTVEINNAYELQDHNAPPPEYSIINRPDIQAILSVIGRRKVSHEKNSNYRIVLNGSNLHGADLTKAILERAYVMHANLRGAKLKDANLRYASFDEGSLRNVFLWESDCRDAGFSKGDLTHLCSVRANFENAFFVGTDLRKALIHDCNLKYARLMETNFQEADLQGSSLQRSFMERTNFEKALLWKVDFKEAEFEQVNFKGAKLVESNLLGAEGLNLEDISKAATLYNSKFDTELYDEIISKFPNLLKEKPEFLNKKYYAGIPWMPGG